MSLIGRILWARWPIVAIALVCSLLGGLLAIVISPARYDAKARVTLNFLKADPITGVYMDFRRAGGYVQSQIRMVQDIEVVGPAVEASGWLDDPDMIASYQARDPRDTRDMTTWAAERIMPGIRASMVQDSGAIGRDLL